MDERLTELHQSLRPNRQPTIWAAMATIQTKPPTDASAIESRTNRNIAAPHNVAVMFYIRVLFPSSCFGRQKFTPLRNRCYNLEMRRKTGIAGGLFDLWSIVVFVRDLLGGTDLLHSLTDRSTWLFAYGPFVIGTGLLVWAFWPEKWTMKPPEKTSSDGPQTRPISPTTGLRFRGNNSSITGNIFDGFPNPMDVEGDGNDVSQNIAIAPKTD